MPIKCTVKLEGQIHPGDLQSLFMNVMNAAYVTNKAKMFSTPKMDQHKNTITFDTAQTKEATLQLFDQTFDKLKPLQLFVTAKDGSIQRRSLGYTITMADIPVPHHS